MVLWDMLPLDKVERVKEYKEQGTVLMVGDGINDTAALSSADIGLSFASATAWRHSKMQM